MEPTVHSSVAGEVTSGNYVMNADTGYYFVNDLRLPVPEEINSPSETETDIVKDTP